MGNGKICVICGEELMGRQRKYCSETCEKEGEKRYRKEYKKNNKEQIRESNRKYTKKNKEKRKKYREDNKEEIAEYQKQYQEDNKEKIKEGKKEYRKNNVEKIKDAQKKYAEENKEKLKIYREENKDFLKKGQKKYREKNIDKIKKYRSRPIYRLNNSVAGSLRQSLKSNNLSKNGRHWEDIVGYTIQELKDHLESLFLPGMTWENHGEWHIDHIIPMSFFVYESTDDVEFKYCWSLDNLQPLWAFDNISKGNKIDKKYFK